jgi:hypothetical protein
MLFAVDFGCRYNASVMKGYPDMNTEPNTAPDPDPDPDAEIDRDPEPDPEPELEEETDP